MRLIELVTCGRMKVDMIDRPVFSNSSGKQEKRRQRKSKGRAWTMMRKPSLDAIPENDKLVVPLAKSCQCDKMRKNIEKARLLRTTKPSPAVEERCRYDDMQDAWFASSLRALAF